MTRHYKPTHMDRMRQGRAFKAAVRGEIIPVRRAARRGVAS